MLFKLSLKNVRKSFKDYAIYFITLILGVAIFYVFNSIDSQQAYLSISNDQREILQLMIDMLSGVSIFVSIILGFLIIYANRFLIKRRKKEFGIYMTLGMGKGKISRILLFETILIGILSLFVGLTIGIFLSQGMSVLVAQLFEVDMTSFTFNISNAAIIKTIIYFGIMYLLVMFFNTFNISKQKLIDLISAGKKNEKLKIKNPLITTIVFLISIAMLGYAYYNVTRDIQILGAKMLYTCIGLGIVGTYLFFWSLSGFLLKVVSLRKKLYLKDLNMFVLRQINSKINTAVMSMSVICIMLFLTICISSAAFSLNDSLKKSIKELTPVDVNILQTYYETGERDSILENLKQFDFDETILENYLEITAYKYESINMEYMFREIMTELLEKYPSIRLAGNESMILLSDYNKLAEYYGHETIALNDNQYLIVANYEQMIEYRNLALEKNTTIEIEEHILYPKYKEIKNGFVSMAANPTNIGLIVIPDYLEPYLKPKINFLAGNYSCEDKTICDAKIKELNEDIWNQVNSDSLNETESFNKEYYFTFNTKIEIYEAGTGLGAMVTFIGLYLGIIFLISSAAILALKELSESSDSKERYEVLRKIGTNEKMIHKALFRQIAVFFLLPLCLALVHSVFGIMVARNILETLGKQDLILPIIMTSIFIIVIYGGYFLITYFSSKRIISER